MKTQLQLWMKGYTKYKKQKKTYLQEINENLNKT